MTKSEIEEFVKVAKKFAANGEPSTLDDYYEEGISEALMQTLNDYHYIAVTKNSKVWIYWHENANHPTRTMDNINDNIQVIDEANRLNERVAELEQTVQDLSISNDYLNYRLDELFGVMTQMQKDIASYAWIFNTLELGRQAADKYAEAGIPLPPLIQELKDSNKAKPQETKKELEVKLNDKAEPKKAAKKRLLEKSGKNKRKC